MSSSDDRSGHARLAGFPHAFAAGKEGPTGPQPARFTPEQADRIVQRILSKAGGTLRCHVCDTHEWHMSAIIARIDSVGETDRGYPAVVLVCKNCGQMLLFNALVLGVRWEALDAESDV